jgi:SAM-dependent methyltransferase
MRRRELIATQEQAFLTGEGDAWLRRNRQAIKNFDPARDPVTRALTTIGVRPRRILEYGCSLGTRLSWLCSHFGAHGVGVEPSKAAIISASTRDSSISWVRGTMDRHPELPGGLFDLVVCSFVLHWVDRRRLLQSLAAVDCYLKEGGCVAIADFYSSHLVRREYHHLPGEGIYTYKADYPAMLVATGLYRPVLQQMLGYPDFRSVKPGSPTECCQVAVLERIELAAIPTV